MLNIITLSSTRLHWEIPKCPSLTVATHDHEYILLNFQVVVDPQGVEETKAKTRDLSWLSYGQNS